MLLRALRSLRRQHRMALLLDNRPTAALAGAYRAHQVQFCVYELPQIQLHRITSDYPTSGDLQFTSHTLIRTSGTLSVRADSPMLFLSLEDSASTSRCGRQPHKALSAAGTPWSSVVNPRLRTKLAIGEAIPKTVAYPAEDLNLYGQHEGQCPYHG
jgi:hypothetical protein